MSWTVEALNETVEEEIEALPEDMRARLARIALLIERKACSAWESRTSSTSRAAYGRCGSKGKSGISQALYVTVMAQRVVILRVFIKKTERTPRRETDLALARTKLIKETEK